jgi:hypothetical protein
MIDLGSRRNGFYRLSRIGGEILARVTQTLSRRVLAIAATFRIGFSRSGLNAYLDWQTRFIKIPAFKTFKTAKVARISELI